MMKRPRDPVARSKLIFDMLTGEVPNDKAEKLRVKLRQYPLLTIAAT